MEDDPLLSLANEADTIPLRRPAVPQSGHLNRATYTNNGNNKVPAVAGRDKVPIYRPGVIPVSNLDAVQRPGRPLPPQSTQPSTSFLRQPPTARPGAPVTGISRARAYSDLGQGSFIQRHSGLKIINPLVSSTQLEARVDSGSVVRLSAIRTRQQTCGLHGRWTTLAVVGEVSAPRQTSNGKSYIIWKITDLDQTIITLFLFGKAYQEFKRDGEPGALIALFCPKIKAEGGEFSMSIDNDDQILLLGTASEFGFCRGTKRDGKRCTNPVNKVRCGYCAHHVGKEYGRVQSMRIELQGNQLKSAFMPGMKRSLNWESGKFQTAEAAMRPRMAVASATQLKEAAAAAAKAGRGSVSSGARYVKTVADPVAARAEVQDIEISKLRRNKLTPGTAPIPQLRTSAVVYEAPLPGKRKGRAAGPAAKRARNTSANDSDGGMVELEEDDLFASTAAEEVMGAGQDPQGSASGGNRNGRSSLFNQTNSSADATRQRALEARKSAAVPMGRGTGTGVKVPEFLAAPLRHREQAQQPQQEDEAEHEKHQGEESEAARKIRQAAIAAARRGLTGPSAPSSSSGLNAGSRQASRAPAGLAGSKSLAPSKGKSKPQAPASGFAAAFGSVIAEMEAAHASDSAIHGSLYKDAVADADADQLFATMEVLERKDDLAQKMDSVKTLKVTAWRCGACGCTTEYRPKACGEAHPRELTQIQAVKRWWECNGCKGRFCTVGLRYPNKRCPKCDVPGTDFTAVSMLRPQRQLEHQVQQGKVAGREGLLVRGTEQKWINQ